MLFCWLLCLDNFAFCAFVFVVYDVLFLIFAISVFPSFLVFCADLFAFVDICGKLWCCRFAWVGAIPKVVFCVFVLYCLGD